MNIIKYIKLEFIKINSSYIKYTILIPIALSALLICSDFIIRKDFILTSYSPIITNSFHCLLVENHLILIWPLILTFSILINSISIFYLDLKNNSITYILSSSMTRNTYYISKILTILIITILSILLEGILLLLLAFLFNLSPYIDGPLLVRYMWTQLFCTLSLIGLQCFLFSLSRQIMTLSIVNIFAICLSMLLSHYPSLVKLSPYYQVQNTLELYSSPETILSSIFLSIISFAIFTLLGLIIFNFIDIKED